MGMKNKERGREREEAKRNIIKKSLSVAIAAVLVSSMLIAFMPLAAADISSFTITPCRSLPGEVLGYNVVINTTGFTSLDMVIPAGFEAVAPGCGELLAEVWLWDDESHEYYITLTSNCTNKIDVCCRCDEDELKYTFPASYGSGDTIEIEVSCWGAVAQANLTLPTGTVDGSLSMSSPKTLTNVIISIKEFVRNPTECGDYNFDLTVNGDTASYPVCIMYPGDITGPLDVCDNKVNLWDLVALADAYLSQPEDAKWNPCADLNCDGKIDIWDLIILADNYMKPHV